MKKKISDGLVDVIKRFGDYVEKQGGDRAVELNKLAQPIETLIDIVMIYHTKKYLVFGCETAMIMSGAEQIVDRGLKDGMSRKRFYKDIYQDVKSRVELFVELHGKSEVISKQLVIE